MNRNKNKVLVFGNPLVPKDSMPLRLMGKLRKMFPELEFKEFDPSENLEKEGRELNIIDAVEDIKKVMLITDIDRIKLSKVYSMHDFDLGYSLKLLKKLNYIDCVRIFCVPMRISEKKALEQLSALISTELSRKIAIKEVIDASKIDLRANPHAFAVYKIPVVLTYSIVQVRQVVKTKEGPQTAKAGDAVLTGTEGERWPVPKDRFEKTYDVNVDGSGTCSKKKMRALAIEMDHPFSVNPPQSNQPLNGKGKPGDYLVQYKPGDMAVVSKKIFEETYVRI